jgi:hypothetical protein
MLKVDSWRIFYADGSTFSSADGSWSDAPPFGVQCVAYYNTHGVTLHTEANDESVYVYQGENELEGIKMGLWMDSKGYYRILDIARGSSMP